MKINYHFHSGVSVESGKDLFIFDYYKQGLSTEILEQFSNVYVFASHNHGDHFDKAILDWTKIKPDIKYIFSDDIKISGSYSDMFFMKPGEELKIDGINISTLDSTDEGVAFFAKTQYGNIFHAGDLNWWHWEGEPEEYNQGMADKYRQEINKLIGEQINIAFIPIDKRLEGSMYYSIDYLMEKVDIKTVCPIHFMDDWKYIEKVKKDLVNREYYNRLYFYGR